MSNDSDSRDGRRQFLKNISLAGLGIGLAPVAAALGASGKGTETVSGGCDPTTLDYYGQGPFYTAGAPLLPGGELAGISEPGTKLTISGWVRNLDCTEVIPGALLDIWHADDSGAYDNLGYNLRGKVESNAAGFYLFHTIKPGKYLNGAMYRPSHIHLKITPPGFPTLTTQLYFEGDTDIPADAAASITSGTYNATHRIIPLVTNLDGSLDGTWDIILNGDGIVNRDEPHLETGMIYKASPNPFSEEVNIQYGVFRQADINMSVYDLSGRLVARLEEQRLPAGKYTAVWKPDATLSRGYYFVALKVNDMQVHYVKAHYV